MSNLLINLLLVYLSFIFLWFIINLTLYFLAVALKRKVIIDAILYLSIGVTYIVNTIVGLAIFVYMISLFLNGQWLWFIIFLFIGGSLVSGVFSFIQVPFVLISGYFSEKAEKLDFSENIERIEVLDEKGKVIGVTEGNTNVTRRMALYFLALYAMNIVAELIYPSPEGSIYGIRWFIETPFTQIIGGTIILGIPYIIYHKVKYKVFFTSDKRYFFIQVWKLNIIVFGSLGLFLLLFT